MTRLATVLIVGLAGSIACAASAQQAPAESQTQPPKQAAQPAGKQEPPVNAQGQALLEFKTRLDKYVELRNQADNTAKPQKQTAEPADIKDAQLSLAERIGVARKAAKPGDIFTPDVAPIFRRLLRSESKETGTKAVIKDDNPEAGVPFKINGPYPDTEPLSTVPANVLETLPPLPKDIEYRFVKKHLILRDVRANLIIDYLLNAIP